MGRIRHISINVALTRQGYSVRLAVFDEFEVIHRDTYDQMTWREAETVVDAILSAHRPGLELLNGGVQQTLFD